MIVVRDGRVVHHELDPALEAKGVRVCGIATCDDDDVARARSARRPRASEDAFTRAARRVPRRRRVRPRSRRRRGRGPDPRAALVRGRRPGVVPAHARRRSARAREATVLDRFGSPETDHLVDAVTELIVGDNAHLRYLSVQEHGSRTWHLGFQRAHVGRDATLRTSAVALGGDYARLRSEARARRARAPRATSSRCTSATARRCSTSARSRITTRRTRAATCCSRARSRTTPARCTRVSSASAEDGAEGERVADQPQPRAHRRRERGVDPEPRDRGERRAVLARVDGRADRRRPALLPREPRHPARGGRAPHRARVLRRRVRAAARSARSTRGLRRSVVDKLEHRRARR